MSFAIHSMIFPKQEPEQFANAANHPQQNQQVQSVANCVFFNNLRIEKLAKNEKISVFQKDDVNNTNDNYTALHIAAQFGDLKFVKDLLEKGADVAAIWDEGITPLHLAAQNGHLDIVLELLKFGINVDIPTNNGTTPLLAATQAGHLQVVIKLLDKGASPFAVTKERFTVLHFAAQNGHTTVLEFFLELGIDVNIRANDSSTPLHNAARSGKFNAVDLLLQKGADLKTPMRGGTTALHFAAKYGILEFAKKILESGVDVNATTENGITPLHFAAQNGKLEVVEELLKVKGIEVDAIADGSITPLYIAAQNGHTEIVKKLLLAGANIQNATSDKASPLHIAAHNGHGEIVREIINSEGIIKHLIEDEGDRISFINKKIYTGDSALHFAATFGYEDIVKTLLNANAEANKPDKFSRTALTKAIESRCLKTILHLIEAKAELNKTNRDEILTLCSVSKESELLTLAAIYFKKPKEEIIRQKKLYIKSLKKQMHKLSEKVSKEFNIDNKSDASHSAYEDLLVELIKEDNAVPKKIQSKIKRKKKNPSLDKLEIQSEILPTKEVISAATPEITLNPKREFISIIYNRINKYKPKFHTRVSRWKENDPDIIAQFMDNGFQNYRFNTPKQNLLLRAKHYLPGSELLAKDPIYRIYTSKGTSILAEFIYKNRSQYGVVSFGYDQNKVIYHRFFEELSINATIFTRNKKHLSEEKEKQEIEEEGQWRSITPYTFKPLENGCIQIDYPGENHKLKVYPANQDLLEEVLGR
ncbi:MAG: ankyrin repeat domain-containing protein [Waddliaceae bacterium]